VKESRPIDGSSTAIPIVSSPLELHRFSIGVGDRFAHQAASQLRAFDILRSTHGILAVPVWNKSNREHTFIGSEPASVRAAAAAAVANAKWSEPWHVDADHIRIDTVDRFLASSDFFTIDVAESIGQPAPSEDVDRFIAAHPELTRAISVDGIEAPLMLSEARTRQIAAKYLSAAIEAGAIDRKIAAAKGGQDHYIAEVSMDETDQPQTPVDLLVILAMLADQRIRLQTIAPKFTGRFNKGVDYVGDLHQFRRELYDDLAVLRFATQRYGLPKQLKLSIHSGSDKFSLYPIIREAVQATGAGFHLKTAGTTWLEELIGLAESGDEGRRMVQQLYAQALQQIDALCGPYASVIDIDRAALPTIEDIQSRSGPALASTLRHVPGHPQFDANVRQLLHVAFKLAAKQGQAYLDLLQRHAEIVGKQVTENLYQRHLKPLFVG
jgi:tagaturonate epimerase